MQAIKLAVFGAAMSVSAAASAATFDVGVVGSPFSYAQYNSDGSFTAFTAGCPARPDLTSCYQGPDGAGNSQVVYDGGLLVAHPGTVGTTAVLFTAPVSALYTFNVTAALLDGNGPGTDGVTVAGYYTPFGAFGLGALTPPVGGTSASQTFAGSIYLNAGQQIGAIFGNNGTNSNDSVGLSGAISFVPEPASWAMMIGGFGVVGGALRSRRQARVSVRYA